jgi:hypothetical protein
MGAVRILAAIVLCALLSPAATADEPLFSPNPIGAAIALSVDPTAVGYCRDHDAGRAIACALEECEADGGENCRAEHWCAVAGAAGVMSGTLAELGLSSLFAACGGLSQEGVEAILRAKCEVDAGHDDCSMVVTFDHEGVDHRAGE